MSVKTINSEVLKEWLEDNKAIIVDVREPAEYKSENIPGSKLIPLATICKDNLPNCDGKKLVIHCKAGGRGSKACEKLLAEDPNLEIYNLEGGITAWGSFGGEVEKSGNFLPLDRQVQLTIGLFVLLGSILGYFVNPLFFLLSGFFGAGLTFAGLTGFCGLAMLMAKMPWNKSSATSCLVK